MPRSCVGPPPRMLNRRRTRDAMCWLADTRGSGAKVPLSGCRSITGRYRREELNMGCCSKKEAERKETCATEKKDTCVTEKKETCATEKKETCAPKKCSG